MTRNKRTVAIILNWNGMHDTAQCCESLLSQANAEELDIVIVDNGSTENTLTELSAACAGADVVGTGQNLGFAGGVNFGIRHAVTRHPDTAYFWLLNNDTVCSPDALEKHLAVAESGANIGIVSCNMIQLGGENDGEKILAGHTLRPPFFIPQHATNVDKTDYVCGASMLIKRETLDDIGLLDERFFFFFEDADLCFSARAKGWRLGIVEDPVVAHAGSATIRKSDYNRAKFYRMGYVLFLRKHARFPLPASLPTTLFRFACDLARFNFAAARGTVSGFVAGWSNLCERQPLIRT